MAAEKEIMVAIEFGSSKIRGIAGCRNLDGTIHILDVVQEDAKNCIRKGVIYNMDKTVLCLKRIVQKLESDLDLEVIKVYVGLNGKSLRTIKNVVSRQLDTKIVISSDLVDGLCESNKETVYPDYEILEVVPQEYRIGAELTLDPVGILSNQLEGRFLNVIARTTIKEYVRKCVEAADLEIAGYFITPLAQADSVLTDTERRSGCVLVDFGADLTTVAIYKNNVLRHLAVIPLGGNNVTLDICSLRVEEEEAERLKFEYGTAYSEQRAEGVVKTTSGSERTIETRELVEVVEARMEEILGNVWEQICQSGYRDKLIAGMVITGGGANMKNMDRAIMNRMGLDKVRFARIVNIPFETERPDQIVKDGTANAMISLLSKGTQTCVRFNVIEEKVEEEEPEIEEEVVIVDNVTENTDNDTSKKETKPEEEEPKRKSKPGFFSRVFKTISDISRKMVDEE